jgi:lipopolysaccharide/colanic/teichoic acid biosynthesis glycosyltransferase
MSGSSYQFTKRILDILGAAIGICLFGLLYLILGPAIKIDSPGPIVVGLPRVSRGKTITLYKFRSMRSGAHQEKESLRKHNHRTDGPFFKMTDDPRITFMGRIIRSTRLDEVPQFINVLTGDLSLVGPRPHEPGEVAQYPAQYQHLPQALAGITGLSQISGASSLPFLKELELDDHYLRTQSLASDLRIIGKTVAIFLFDPTAV